MFKANLEKYNITTMKFSILKHWEKKLCDDSVDES